MDGIVAPPGRQRGLGGLRLLSQALVLASLAAAPASLVAQANPGSADAYRDVDVEALMQRARAARGRDAEGIRSYEGLFRERIYVGLTALRFRRERGLFEQERVARLRWSADGERAIQWVGARRAIPIVGADTRQEATGHAGTEVRNDLREELPRELLRDTNLSDFPFDPAGDRLSFGGDWALNPMADTADAHYRFASGDTLRLTLPDRVVRLLEVKVEPRRADFHLVAGSLWFDSESSSLVRASYRPARPFNLALDEPEDAEDVPGFIGPIEGHIDYITVEYSLHELRYWLPRRFALEGEARIGALLRIPMTVEWLVRDYRVNEADSELPLTGPLPRGWSRAERRMEDADGGVHYVTVLLPHVDSLVSSPELTADFGTRSPAAFSDREISQLREELEALLPTYRPYRPRVAWGLQRGLVRFNRVEGLSVGLAATVPLTPVTELDAEARIGSADREPGLALSLLRGPEPRRWTLDGYHRLEGMNDWSNAFSFTNSLSSALLGNSREEFVRVTGASLGYARVGQRVRWELEGFRERHRPVGLNTDFSVKGLFREDSVHPVLSADEVTISGARGLLRWFRGVDPNALVLAGEVRAEATVGDATYQRAAVTLSASHPLPFGLAGALEVAGGSSWGDELPVQRSFFLGGSPTLRGFDGNELRGAAFWRARAEVANGFAGARISTFSDAGWAGPRDSIRLDGASVAVGVGASLLDGLLRADLARAVRGGSGWKIHLYLDGLL